MQAGLRGVPFQLYNSFSLSVLGSRANQPWSLSSTLTPLGFILGAAGSQTALPIPFLSQSPSRHFLPEPSLSGQLPSGSLDLRLTKHRILTPWSPPETSGSPQGPWNLHSVALCWWPQILIAEAASPQPHMGPCLVTNGHQPF